MKIVIDHKGPIGSDCTSRDLCHFENPSTPKLCEVVDFILSFRREWGTVTIFNSYDPVKDVLGKYITAFEYKYGSLVDAGKGGYAELMQKRVKLASTSGGWSLCDYSLYLAE